MEHQRLIDLLLETVTLKWMPRTGWGMRGVSNVESVAEHSFGVAFLALVLVDSLPAGLEPNLDREKVLILALIHDLAEVRLTDLPASAVQLLPAELKSRAEATALAGLLAPLPTADRLVAVWREFEEHSSPEGRLVRDADKLEMMLQCLRYEQAGSRGLDEFWRAMDRYPWHYGLCTELYAQLWAMRPAGAAGVSER